MHRSATVLTIAYLCAGAFWTGVAYLLTGIDQTGSVDSFEWVPSGNYVRWLPTVLAGFLLTRALVAILVGATLAWWLKMGWPRRPLLLVGPAVPTLCEVLLVSASSGYTWTDMFWDLAKNWPTYPSWVLPADALLQTTAAYLVPPMLAGLTLAVWLVGAEERTPTEETSSV